MALNIVVGAALLFFGRRLFWLFVAGVGFVAGGLFATQLLAGQPEWVILAIALAVGVVCALLSVFLQRLLIGIAGFLAGGYIVYHLALTLNYPSYEWIGFIVGGIIGAVLVEVLFDWALIGLSGLVGAIVISANVPLDQALSAALFFVLLAVGIYAQAKQLRPKPIPS
ncbi:MAG: DUF4203 domain-containing protein [Candidatus Omnitrophica bacterium]|nr:DUF4203 domain-containing protein [Candidatus Omnitrophota bacterium]